MQFVGDKENKEMIHNQLKSFTNGSLVHSCTLSTFPLYNWCNTIVQWRNISLLSSVSTYVC